MKLTLLLVKSAEFIMKATSLLHFATNNVRLNEREDHFS